MAARVGDGGGTGSARRRRERRLRSFLVRAPLLTRTEEGQGWGRGASRTHGEVPDALLSPGHRVWVCRGGHMWGWSGTSWSTWRTSAPSCRFLMLLCRRWVSSWYTFFRSLDTQLPDRRAQDLRRHHPAALRGADCLVFCFAEAADCRAVRQQRLPSRTFPLQLRVVEVLVVVFKVFLRFRGSATTFPVPLGDAGEVFFLHFFPGPKKCEGWCSLQVGTGRALELIHAGR